MVFYEKAVGYMAAARWDEKWNIQNEQRRLFATGSGNSLILKKDFEVDRTLHEVNLNGYLALEARYLEDHKIYVKLLAIRQSTDEARIEGGFTDSEDFDIRRTTLKW